MLRMTCALMFLTVAPALAQDYTILALSHTDNKVSEVDPLTGETLREFVVPGEWFGETHEGAVSPDGRTIYVSVPYAKQVVILDLDTFEERGAIESEYFSRPPQVRGFARIGRRESTSSDPHGVALNRDGSKLYITVEYAEVPGIVVYDVEAGTVKKIDTVIAGNYLWVHPRTDKLYFPTRDDRVVVIDTKTDRIVKVIRLHEGSRPNGVDFGGPNDEVWVNGDGDGSVTVIDSATDEVITVLQPRVSGAGRVAVSPDGRFAAATQGPEVSIIDTQAKEIVANLRISPNERGHGFPLFSPDSHTLHVMNELSDDMVTFDMRTLRQVGTRTPIGGAVFGGGIRVAPAAAQSNPYRQVEAPMPPADMNGGEWGEMIQVHLGPEGNVFVLHRCFKVVLGDPGVAPGHSDGLSADCFGRWASHPPILKFAPSGEFLASFGVGMFGRPHGFAVDHEGNMWVTDVGLVPDQMGAVVVKLSPDGEVLMTLGTAGVTGQGPDTFNRPSGVAVAPNGEIFVTDGEGPNNRVVKFSREGRFIQAWGTTGPEPGNFSTPHDLAIDSRGRVFVGDRGNSRVQIFDQDGNFLDQWSNFGRPSGIYINRETDVLYVTDSQSNSRNNPGFQRGIYIGSALTGEVTYFIPDPDLADVDWTRISGASGVAADATDTVVYAADVAPRQLRKYIRP